MRNRYPCPFFTAMCEMSWSRLLIILALTASLSCARADEAKKSDLEVRGKGLRDIQFYSLLLNVYNCFKRKSSMVCKRKIGKWHLIAWVALFTFSVQSDSCVLFNRSVSTLLNCISLVWPPNNIYRRVFKIRSVLVFVLEPRECKIAQKFLFKSKFDACCISQQAKILHTYLCPAQSTIRLI